MHNGTQGAAALCCAAAVVLGGCFGGGLGPDGADGASQRSVTLVVTDMNHRLKILWGDWPNPLKQALAELDGVSSVEDEWERELESDEDLNVLFVKFDPALVDEADLLKLVREQGFEARVE